MSLESVMLSNHLILCCPFLFLPSIFTSIMVFSNESALCIRWPKYWSFSMSLSNAYSELISFRIDWFDLALHGALESPPALQFASTLLWHSLFYFTFLIMDFKFYMNQTFCFLSFIFHQNMITFSISLFSFSVCLTYPRIFSSLVTRIFPLFSNNFFGEAFLTFHFSLSSSHVNEVSQTLEGKN